MESLGELLSMPNSANMSTNTRSNNLKMVGDNNEHKYIIKNLITVNKEENSNNDWFMRMIKKIKISHDTIMNEEKTGVSSSNK